jgi:HEAT repeat protein
MKFIGYRGCLTLAVLMLLGCDVTSEKIVRWKESSNGAPKLRAAMRDAKQKIAIRVEAAEALCELGLFQPLSEDIKTLSGPDREKVMEDVIGRLLTKMRGSNPKATTRLQLQGKDALFSLREFATGKKRDGLDEEVGRWILTDWQNRNGGEHSGDKIISAMGAVAGPLLVEALSQSPTLVLAFATQLRKVGDEAARDAGAIKLVELAQKESPPSEQTLQALGTVGSLKALAYLQELAFKGELDLRRQALLAMALYPHASMIGLAKKMVADTSLKGDLAILRDEAFTLLEKMKDPQALDALASFLESKDDKVRYRAVEAILSGFKDKGLTKLLQALPSGYTYKKQDFIDFIENDIVELGGSALGPLREALQSTSWIARLIAVRVLAKKGSKADLGALEKLTTDSTKLRGWEAGATLGSEAKAAAERINHGK